MGFSSGSVEKNLPPMQEMQETQIQSLGREDPSEEGMATHSNILAWRIPWQGSLAGYSHSITESDTAEVTVCMYVYLFNICMYVCMHVRASLAARWYRMHVGQDTWVRKSPWRRKWQPTPVFLSEEFSWTEEPGGLQPTGSQRVRHYGPWTQLQPTATIDIYVCVYTYINKHMYVCVYLICSISLKNPNTTNLCLMCKQKWKTKQKKKKLPMTLVTWVTQTTKHMICLLASS